MHNNLRCSCLAQTDGPGTLQCPVHQANASAIDDEAVHWGRQRTVETPSVMLYPPVPGNLASFLSLLATIAAERLQREAVRQNDPDGVQYTYPNERRQVA